MILEWRFIDLLYETVFIRTICSGRIKGFGLSIEGTVIDIFIRLSSGIGIIEWSSTAYRQRCGQENDGSLFHGDRECDCGYYNGKNYLTVAVLPLDEGQGAYTIKIYQQKKCRSQYFYLSRLSHVTLLWYRCAQEMSLCSRRSR